jgi:pyruvate dehydrogenase E1 component alpha subunit
MKADGAIDQPQLDSLDAEIRAEVEDAVRFADESPDPDPAALYADVFAD